MQLLYYQAPLSALILLLLIPVFEPVSTTITVHWTAAEVVSCQHTLTSIWHWLTTHGNTVLPLTLFIFIFTFVFTCWVTLYRRPCPRTATLTLYVTQWALHVPCVFLSLSAFLFLVWWHQRTWYCFIVKFFWCNSWAVSVSFHLCLYVFCLFYLFFFSLFLTLC